MSNSRLRPTLCALVLLAAPAYTGEITGVTDFATGLAFTPTLVPLDHVATYEISIAQSVGDPLIRGVHFALPTGFETVTVTDPLGGGDVQIDVSGLGGTWSVSNAGGFVNIVDSGAGVASGSFQVLFDRIPGGTRLEWAHAVFSDDGLEMPAANVIANTPGDEIRIPVLVLERGFNRLQLDNGGDVFVSLSNPTVGSDPPMGDYSGDLYTKVYPKEVLLHPKGTMSVTGIQYSVFDTDWDLDDADLWSWALTVGVESSDTVGGGSGVNPGNIEPLFTDPLAVILPEVPGVGLGNPLGFGNCPPANEIAGWDVVETFLDMNGQPVDILELVADGTTDYVFTHFAPDGHELFSGGANCGPGNATLSYLLSTDFKSFPFASFDGENQPDFLGTGYSAFGGERQGGSADFAPNGVDETPVVRFFFDEPTLSACPNAGTGTGIEHGLAGMNLPIGVDSGGVPTGASATVGWRMYSDSANPGTPGANALRVGAVFGTIGAPLPAPGFDLNGACFMMNPSDILFVDSFIAWGLLFFEGVDSDSDGDVDYTIYESAQAPVKGSLALIDLTIYVQGLDLQTVSLAGESTQVWQLVLRASDT